MASAREEKIAGRARRAAAKNVKRFQSLMIHCDHAPTWMHLKEARNGDALAYEMARETAATQYMPGVVNSKWNREGTR